jgi:hypothetical protein
MPRQNQLKGFPKFGKSMELDSTAPFRFFLLQVFDTEDKIEGADKKFYLRLSAPICAF